MRKAKKLRVVHAITAFTYGGAQRSLIDFILSCPKWVDSRAVTLYPGPMSEQLTARGIPVWESDLRGTASLLAIARWVRYFRKHRPHIVHTHLGKADFCGRIAAAIAGVPAIVTTSWNIEHWKDSGLLNALDNLSLKPAGGILACSSAVKDYLIERGQPAEKIWVSLARAELRDRFPSTKLPAERAEKLREELGLSPGANLTIMVGRFYPQKAHDVALRALAKMPADSEHVLLMAGDGPLKPEMERLAERLLAPERYRFLGNRKDIADLLLLSDIFLMPSRWEGAPLALSESYAAGLPSIVSDIPSMDEVVKTGGGSIIFPKGNDAALADAWGKLLANDAQRKALGTCARAAALEKLDIRLMRDEYLGCYADLLAGRMAPNPLPGSLNEYL